MTTAVLLFALLLAGCSCDETPTKDAGIDGSTDGDTDTDADSDGDTDTDSDTDADAGPDASSDSGPPVALEWIPMPGGTYLQGTVQGENNEKPAHTVNVPSFEMMKTEVTVFHYAECVDAGACSLPATSEGCNWGVAGRGNHPVNYVNVYQAEEFCAFVGGRLPSESEWEYAARGLGQDFEYPWGDEEPDCDKAVIRWLYGDTFIDGCGTGHTWPVCSKPAGNTPQGLCDMGGNVYEWVPDRWHVNYYGAPTDGSVWATPPDEDSRILRGGAYRFPSEGTRSRMRTYYPQNGRSDYSGFRCARDCSESPDAGVLDAGAEGGI